MVPNGEVGIHVLHRQGGLKARELVIRSWEWKVLGFLAGGGQFATLQGLGRGEDRVEFQW